MLITLEGIDGSGKTAAAGALYAHLAKNYHVILTKEPGGTDLGKHLRSLLQQRNCPVSSHAELLLFAADRAQHFHERVLPALQSGTIVISDRMADSSRAYQGFGRGLDDAWIDRLSRWAMQDRMPDVTVYLKLPYEIARQRLQKRNEEVTAFEQERAAFFERVIAGFDELFTNRPLGIIVDATQPEDVVHHTIISHIEQVLQQRQHQRVSL